jgi:hypothetical protein
MAEKMITLTEAFRVLLRAGYPQRPALADEIQSYRYFHSAPFDKETGRRIDPEAQAADEALAKLKDAVISESVRLRARLGDNTPNDIEPMEVVWNGVHVFDNTLEVYERGRTLRTYRNVHCYAAEIDALISPAQAGQPRRLTKKSAVDYVAAYIKDDVNPTIDGLGDHAIQDGIVGGREMLRVEFRRQRTERGHVVGKRGRRKLETRASITVAFLARF